MQLPGPGTDLVCTVLRDYELPWDGLHGLPHWARVLETGHRLAADTGADPEIVSLFALFHDSRRQTEGWDHGHGLRGAELASRLRGVAFELDDDRFALLWHACAHHTDGLTEGDVTVLTCWDADRLDLGRVGITPRPKYLGTEPARRAETIAWAEERSRRGHVPPIVSRVWLPAAGLAP